MLHTVLCKRIGIEQPIFCAGMGSTAGPELAAAVCNAGGVGVLGTACLSAKMVCQRIAALRSLTARPFGVNVVLAIARRGQIEVCLEETVPVLVLFWGEVAPYVAEARKQAVMLIAQVGSVAEAEAAADAGVDAVMAQGVEAGGHVRGSAEDTVLTVLFDGGFPAAPHRVLRNRAFEDWQAAASPVSGHRPGEGEVIGTMQSGGAMVDISRYSAYNPEAQLAADVEHMALYAGQSCELVHDIKPAGQSVHDLVREAEEAMRRLATGGTAP